MAMELSNRQWKLGFTDWRNKIRGVTVEARNLFALQEQIGRAKSHFGLAEDAPVLSCYEACWDGSPLGPDLKAELEREYRRLELVESQLRTVEAEQQRRLEQGQVPQMLAILYLMDLRGIGRTGAWILVMEFFGWRDFRNRREVASAAGLTGTPYDSGDSEREQGISKAGNVRIRWLIVQLAWDWLRYQPESQLSLWFRERFGEGKRLRRVEIVALARRLLIALWRYVEHGVVPEGAQLKAG